MFRKLSVFLTVLFLLLPTLVTAQETPAPSPRLKSPTPDEYLGQIDEIIAKADTRYMEGDPRDPLEGVAELAAIFDEVNWRYLDQGELTYEQVRRLIRALPLENNRERLWEPDWIRIEVRDRWLPALIDRWLAEHPDAFDFETRRQVSFDEIGMIVTPLLYGKAYFLDVVENPTGFTSRYLAIRTSDGVVVPPLPMSISTEILASGDLNDDGMPDFAYLSGNNIEKSANAGNLHIVSWTGDEFETLTSLRYSEGIKASEPYGLTQNHTWQFLNVDEDPQIEVIQNQRKFDDFDCDSIHITAFDWDEEQQLQPNSEAILFPETFHCLFRQAEESVWAGNYKEAIEFYGQALNIPTDDTARFEFVQMRLALVYLFTGELDKADQIFTELRPSEGSLARIAQQAYRVDPRPLPVCQTLYNAVIDDPTPIWDVSLGTLDEDDGGFYGPMSAHDSTVNVENASCDLPVWIMAALADTTFSVTESPLEKLESFGLKLGESIRADFDHDHAEEWLVWVDSHGVEPIYFVPEAEHYSAKLLPSATGKPWAFSNLRLPTQYNQYSVMTLPDGLGKALVNIDFDIDKYEQISCISCGSGFTYIPGCVEDSSSPLDPVGSLKLFRMEGGRFIEFFYAPVCSLEHIDSRITMGDLTNGVEEFTAEYQFFENPAETYGLSMVREIAYRWDSKLKTFVPQLPTSSPPPPTPFPTSTVSPSGWDGKVAAPRFHWIRSYFQQGNYEEAIFSVTSVLESGVPPGANFVPVYRYYRALSLEAQGDLDAALEEYRLISETAPDSAWGMLASLHIED